MSDAHVGVVFVSHSAKIADGLVDLARQMAPSVALVAAGGTDDGGIGTSFDKVTAALVAADSGAGVVVLGDLGSAMLTAETAIEMLDDEALARRVRLVEAPLVEGGVAVSVAAEAGAPLAGVVAAANADAGAAAAPTGDAAGGVVVEADDAPPSGGSRSTDVRRRVVLRNKDGLHARPAAELVRLGSRFDAALTINGAPVTSLLRIIALGLERGAEIDVAATGIDAQKAVDSVVELVESGFGEE